MALAVLIRALAVPVRGLAKNIDFLQDKRHTAPEPIQKHGAKMQENPQKSAQEMDQKPKPKRSIKRLSHIGYSPQNNPLVSPNVVPVKRKKVRSGLASKELVDPTTGEVTAAAVIHQIEECDSDQFVKVFAAGIAATYELSKTGQRVFQAVLKEYERTPMSGGFADSVNLWWFGDGLSGEDIGMSESTFNRGLWELLDKGFLAPKMPNVFWVNPALFFKGDRVMFVREYRRKSAIADQANRERLEDNGQQRLVE